MSYSKSLSLYILHILQNYATDVHPLNAVQISEYLHSIHNIPEDKPLDRRTIYSNLTLLEDLSEKNIINTEIQNIERNGKKIGHYTIPAFTPGEIKLLCDAVASSRFISQTYSKELIGKLGDLNGQNFTNKYLNIIQFKSNKQKSYNEDVFNSIELLSEAIQKNRKVTFQYLKYNVHKQLIPNNPKDNGIKIVTPYKLIWAINHYYVMCQYENEDKNRFMRVDKIQNVQLLDRKGKALPEDIDWEEYARNQVFMFGGKSETIKFRCKMIMLDQVIDFFGEDVHIKQLDDNYFEVQVKTSINSIKYWVLQYITSIDNIRPAELRQMIIDFLEDALERNKENN